MVAEDLLHSMLRQLLRNKGWIEMSCMDYCTDHSIGILCKARDKVGGAGCGYVRLVWLHRRGVEN